MLLYISRSGNIQRIIEKLNIKNAIEIKEENEIIKKNFVFLTYTDKLGEIPKIAKIFLEKNKKFLIGVAGSGNKNFGKNFCAAAKLISEMFNVPLLMEFELSGNSENIKEFQERYKFTLNLQ